MEVRKLLQQLSKTELISQLSACGFGPAEIKKKRAAELRGLLGEWLISSGFSKDHQFVVSSNGTAIAEPQLGCDCCLDNSADLAGMVHSSDEDNPLLQWCRSHELPTELLRALQMAGLDSPSQLRSCSDRSALQLKELFELKSLPLAILLRGSIQNLATNGLQLDGKPTGMPPLSAGTEPDGILGNLASLLAPASITQQKSSAPSGKLHLIPQFIDGAAASKLSQKDPKIVWKEGQLSLSTPGAKDLSKVTAPEYCQANLQILQAMIDSGELAATLSDVRDDCEHGAQIAGFMAGSCETEIVALEHDQEIRMLVAQNSARFGDFNQYAFQCTIKAAEFCTFATKRDLPLRASQGASSANLGVSKQQSASLPICMKFNFKQCDFGDKCNYLHICSKCRDPKIQHSAKSCTAATGARFRQGRAK